MARRVRTSKRSAASVIQGDEGLLMALLASWRWGLGMILAWELLRLAVRRWKVSVGLFLCLTGWAWTGQLAIGTVFTSAWSAWIWRDVLRCCRPDSAGRGAEELRRRKAIKRLCEDWAVAADHSGLIGRATGEAPPLTHINLTKTGAEARLALGQVGLTTDAAQKAAKQIAASMHLYDVQVHPDEKNPDGVAHIQFSRSDPLRDVIKLSDLPYLGKSDEISFGITSTGAPACKPWGLSSLSVAETGGGKSGLLWSAFASLQLHGIDTWVNAIDPSGGVELAELAENLAPYEKNPTSSWRVHQYADHKLKAMTEVIDNAYTVMETRFDIMRKKRIRKMYPTPENPLYVIAIDELLRMLPQISKETYEKLKELTFLGRKACIVVWALTQLSQQEVLGLWRNLVPTAICLRSFNAATTNAILGSDAESSGARCSKISVHTPGVGFMARNGVPGYTKFRTCWVDDRAMRMIARGELPKELRDKKIPNEHLAVDLSKWRKKVAA